MLSYQHAYHAGNLADVHKHALLASVLAYMTGKDKPLSYLETHAGRGFYDLASTEAKKTGEAAAGVTTLLEHFPSDHPYRRAVEGFRMEYGKMAYPGSPMIASHFARSGDRLNLAELHPQEHAALVDAMPRSGVHIYKEDGFPWAARVCPPTPRRGLIMIDPSYELVHDFEGIAIFMAGLNTLWPVGVVMLWYPILENRDHEPMAEALGEAGYTDALRHEVRFAKAAAHHRLKGSGVFIINAPYTLADEAAKLSALFEG